MHRKTTIIIVLISLTVIIAGILRFWNLQNIPPGVWPDEAMNANDALWTIDSGEYRLFYPDNNGREGLYMWLIALSFQLFGVSIWSLKFFSALVGTVTVLAVYLLAKEIFRREIDEIKASYIGVVAAFLTATSFWHINFSRIAFRAILAPLLMTLSLYFLLKGFRSGKLFNFILSGTFLGLGLHTYISFRIVPLLFAVPLLLFLSDRIRRREFKRYLLAVSLFLAFAVISALPMGLYFYQNPDDFMGRTGQVSVFDAEEPVRELTKSTLLHLGMFNFYGDPNWRHNYSTHPMIPLPVGILFLVGLVAFTGRSFDSVKKRDYEMLAVYSSIPIWFFIMLLPGILTIEGIPHALRVISVIPAVYILAAAGGYLAYRHSLPLFKDRRILIVLTAIFLVGVLSYETHRYFYRWADHPEVRNAFTAQYVEIGNYLNSLPDESDKYLVINEPGRPIHGISISAQTPMFIERTMYDRLRAKYVKFEDLDAIEIPSDREIHIVPLYGPTIDALKDLFPQGSIIEERGIKALKIN